MPPSISPNRQCLPPQSLLQRDPSETIFHFSPGVQAQATIEVESDLSSSSGEKDQLPGSLDHSTLSPGVQAQATIEVESYLSSSSGLEVAVWPSSQCAFEAVVNLKKTEQGMSVNVGSIGYMAGL